MPDWTNYYYSYDAGTPTAFEQYCERIHQSQCREQQMWAEYQELMDKLDRQAEERAEDERKYPLFFLKEGIV